MASLKGIVSQIRRLVDQTNSEIEKIPPKLRSSIQAAVDASTFAYSYMGGMHIITLASTIYAVHTTVQSIRGAAKVIMDEKPESNKDELIKFREEADKEIHIAEVIENAKEKQDTLLHHLKFDMLNSVSENEQELVILEGEEIQRAIEIAHKSWAEGEDMENRRELRPLVTVLTFEIGKIEALITELEKIGIGKLRKTLRSSLEKLFQLKTLIHKRAKLLKKEEEIEEEAEKSIYTISQGEDFLDAQLALLKEHKKALQQFLDKVLGFSVENKGWHAGEWWSPGVPHEISEFYKEHEKIEDKFIATLEHLKERYLSKPQPQKEEITV